MILGPAPSTAAGRAGAAEQAVRNRHLRPLWALPGTALAVNTWPPRPSHRTFLAWNYWWQAHVLDCLVDAQLRAPDPRRRTVIRRLVRGLQIRNILGYRNNYYDDMAWLGLALHRGARFVGPRRARVVAAITRDLRAAWTDVEGGGIPWRHRDEFKNTPANGPAAILLARTGHVDRAAQTADWIHDRLRDRETGLIWDGLRPGLVERVVYTYNQGSALGAELEVSARTGGPRDRIHDLVAAVDRHLSPGGVLATHAGGDSGLFSGILTRYLALVATRLPEQEDADRRAKTTAGALIRTTADAAWENRVTVDGRPLFGHDWTVPAVVPTRTSDRPERDLSVQLSGWMLLEAAATLDAPGIGYAPKQAE